MSSAPRIGLGIDVHRLEAARPCVLGGIEFDCAVGPVGHSDGDAILHAVCDAVLGAAGLEDLGTLFPDDSAANKDRPSADFCGRALELLRAQSLGVLSIDVVVETNLPKLKPRRTEIRTNIARLFDLDLDRVNLKGKTGEDIDAVGEGKAIRATAVVLVHATDTTTNAPGVTPA